MTLVSSITAFSGITEGAPISPAYLNGKFSEVYSAIDALNTASGGSLVLKELRSPSGYDLVLNGNQGNINLALNGSYVWTVRNSDGALYPGTDNTYDIGAVTPLKRPRNLYVGTRIDTPRIAGNGQVFGAPDWSASAGWGSAPTVQSATGTDMAGSIEIICGTTPSANPSLTFSYIAGTWTLSPIVVVARTDASAPTTGWWAVTTSLATSVVFTFVGTPTGGNTYGLSFHAIGRP